MVCICGCCHVAVKWSDGHQEKGPQPHRTNIALAGTRDNPIDWLSLEDYIERHCSACCIACLALCMRRGKVQRPAASGLEPRAQRPSSLGVSGMVLRGLTTPTGSQWPEVRGQRVGGSSNPGTPEPRTPCPSSLGVFGMVLRGRTTQGNRSGQRSAARVSRRPAPRTQRPFTRVKLEVLDMVFQELSSKFQDPKLVTALRPRWATRSAYASLGQGAAGELGKITTHNGLAEVPKPHFSQGVGMPASRRHINSVGSRQTNWGESTSFTDVGSPFLLRSSRR